MRGNILAYLVPTEVVVEAARTSHTEWLRSEPATKGQNRTWNLWFDDDGLTKSNGFGKKWAKYKLNGNSASTSTTPSELPDGSSAGQKLGDVIADAKRRIAAAAGIPEGAVKISIDLS